MGRTAIEIPKEIQEQMCRDYRQGMSVRNIAKIYGMGTAKVYEVLKKSQCEIKVGRPKGKCDIVVQSMMEDYISGLSISKIANKYGYTCMHVYRLFERNHFDINDYKRPKRKDSVIEALKLGELSQSQIAQKCGVSRQYVSLIKKEMESEK